MEIIVKKDLLDELQAKGLCQTKQDANDFVEALIKAIATGIGSGRKVHLDGFGSFQTGNKKRQAKKSLISTAMLITEIIKSLKMDSERVEQAIAMLFHFVKEMIIKGNEVQIFKFASFRIEERKSQIVKSPRTGQRVVVPAKKMLMFEPEKQFGRLVDNKEIQFIPDDSLKKPIERLRSSSILLVVPVRDFFVETIEYHFEKAGWKVNTVQSVAEAGRFINSNKPHMAIIDAEIESYQTFCEALKLGQETSLVPLVILYPAGTDLKKTSYFRICGDEYIMQPFELKQLIKTSQIALRRALEERNIYKQEVLLQFPTLDNHIDKANDICGSLLRNSGLSDEGQVSLGAAFREALANAAQHGNKHRRDRMLEVLYLLDNEKITIVVTDSGFGFPWQKYLNINQAGDAIGRARQSHREGRMGGLGIMLMLRCIDKLEYNDTGNVTTLTKYVKKPE